MPGARCTRSLVCSVLVAHECRHRRSPEHPAFPHAMVLTAYFVLSPEIGLSCLRRLRKCIRRLDAGVEASGPHDFTVRVCAVVLRAERSLTESNPPCDPIARLTQPASTASHPASVTIAIRPSSGTRRRWICR